VSGECGDLASQSTRAACRVGAVHEAFARPLGQRDGRFPKVSLRSGFVARLNGLVHLSNEVSDPRLCGNVARSARSRLTVTLQRRRVICQDLGPSDWYSTAVRRVSRAGVSRES